jgi:hypothetical protein
MAKNIIVAFSLLLLFCGAGNTIQQNCVVDCYLSQVGVREATGRNDGPEVEMYLRSVGLGKGYAWCGAFVRWVFDGCGISTRINAWSPTAHNGRNLVWFEKKWHKTPEPGDVFTVYSIKLKRISHTGFFHRKINDSFYETVEGNTNEGGSREGDGVYMRRRSFNATYSITRWL